MDTAQIDHIGLDAKPTIDKLKKEAHKSNLWQHNNLPLIFVAWSDNNILNNFLSKTFWGMIIFEVLYLGFYILLNFKSLVSLFSFFILVSNLALFSWYFKFSFFKRNRAPWSDRDLLLINVFGCIKLFESIIYLWSLFRHVPFKYFCSFFSFEPACHYVEKITKNEINIAATH